MKAEAVVILMVVAVVLTAGMAFGDDNAITVTVTGKNVNMAKTLCGEDAPVSDRNVLSVTEVKDADGNLIEGYAGKLLHYLPEETSMPLMKGDANLDQDIVVKGVLYKNAQTIQVKEFEWNWNELGITTPSQAQNSVIVCY